jgi:hypothetical protein
MADCHSAPRALFLFQDSEPEPDFKVCSGLLPSHLKGQAYPYSEDGRMPETQKTAWRPRNGSNRRPSREHATSDCGLQKLGTVEAWATVYKLNFPKQYGKLDLYKCRQMFLLILVF